MFSFLTDCKDSLTALTHCISRCHVDCSTSHVLRNAGFEARGLIFGAPLALALKCAFVPLRKPGKLPGETIKESYQLEYGSDTIEMHVGAIREGQRVLLVDDLIATGGTMGAGIKLMGARKQIASACHMPHVLYQGLRVPFQQVCAACLAMFSMCVCGEVKKQFSTSHTGFCVDKVKAEVVECACVIELPDLKGRDKLQDKKLFVLIEKEGL